MTRALPGESGVEILRQFAVGSGRNHVNSTLLPDHFPDLIGLLCSVGGLVPARLQRGQKAPAWGCIMGLTGFLSGLNREAILIGKGMNFRPPPAARAPEATTRVVFRASLQKGEPGQTCRPP